MALEHTYNYRSFLKEELVRRSKRNPKFSLRSLARMLGVSPSLISEVLSGKRNLTEDLATLLCSKLGFKDLERDFFVTLVRVERAKNVQVKTILLRKLEQIAPEGMKPRDLSVDQFIVVSDWYHFAVLRLLDIKDFNFTVANAAKVLGVRAMEIELALERMERLELVEKQGPGRYRKIDSLIRVQSTVPNEALRKYHSQLLQKTIEALTQQGPHERYTSTQNIALSSDQLKAAEKIFDSCLDELVKLSESRKSGAEVYHAGIHMIRLSNRKGSNKI